MRSLPRVLQVLGINSVPVVGLFFGGWSTATALLIYWFENLFSTLLVSLRIARHRRLTGKLGHSMASVSSAQRIRRSGGKGGSSFLRDFLITSLVFTMAHGVFLGVIVFLMFPESYPEEGKVDPGALQQGLLVVAGLQIVGLAMDLARLRDRPFSWIKQMADRLLGRVIVVHLTIIFGMWAMAWLGGPRGLFLVFAGFKTLVDVSTLASSSATPQEEPPRWILGLIRRLGGTARAEEFESFYRQSHRQEMSQQDLWEESA